MIPPKLNPGDEIRIIIRRNPALADIPIIANVDFGHTHPIFTFPIGGKVRMKSGKESGMTIVEH